MNRLLALTTVLLTISSLAAGPRGGFSAGGGSFAGGARSIAPQSASRASVGAGASAAGGGCMNANSATASSGTNTGTTTTTGALSANSVAVPSAVVFARRNRASNRAMASGGNSAMNTFNTGSAATAPATCTAITPSSAQTRTATVTSDSASLDAPSRTWTIVTDTGATTLEAQFVGLLDSSVVLRTASPAIKLIPLDQLSVSDQSFVASLRLSGER